MKNKILNITILIIFIIIALFVGAHHEPWADEAQAWLIARDASVSEILFEIERYEGTPPIWHLLLKFLIVLGYKYEYLYLISVFFSSLGVGLMLFKLDIPKPLKILLPFTYFFLYEYTVKARSYCLILPTLVLIADTYKDRESKPILYNFLLGFLATISLHTAIISGMLYILELYEIFLKITNEKNTEKYQKEIWSMTILGILYILIIICVIPSPDVCVSINALNFQGDSPLVIFIYLLARFLEAFTLSIDYGIVQIVISAIFVSILLFAILFKNKSSKLFISIFVPLCLFLFLIRIATHHIGIIFLTFLFCLYLSKESIVEKNKKVVTVMLIILAIIQIIWSVNTIIPEIKYNYSASRELSDYIKTMDYKDMKIYAFGYYPVAILPYFEENIFCNDRGATTYYKWSIQNPDWEKVINKEKGYLESDLEGMPDIIILYDTLATNNYDYLKEKVRKLEGYKETHFEGQAFFKQYSNDNEKEGYYVFERIK